MSSEASDFKAKTMSSESFRRSSEDNVVRSFRRSSEDNVVRSFIPFTTQIGRSLGSLLEQGNFFRRFSKA